MNLRPFLLVPALLAAALSSASVSVYFALDSAPTVALTALPLTATQTPLSVYYTSDTGFEDSEIFLTYDRSTAQGAGATPLDGKVGLGNASGTAATAINGARTAGAAGRVNALDASHPYGLDLLSVSAAGAGSLPATATGIKLLSVQLSNLALAPGQSYTLGFATATAPQYTTAFYDGNGDALPFVATALTVTASPVPEPGTWAALGLGALALVKRRKRA